MFFCLFLSFLLWKENRFSSPASCQIFDDLTDWGPSPNRFVAIAAERTVAEDKERFTPTDGRWGRDFLTWGGVCLYKRKLLWKGLKFFSRIIIFWIFSYFNELFVANISTVFVLIDHQTSCSQWSERLVSSELSRRSLTSWMRIARESGMSSENHKNSVLLRMFTCWRGRAERLIFFCFGMGFPVFEGLSILQKISFWCLLFGCLEKSSSMIFEFLQQLAKPKARDRVLKSSDSQEVFLVFSHVGKGNRNETETLEVRNNTFFFLYFRYLEVGIHQLEDGQLNIKSLHFWEIKFAFLKGYPGC